MKGLAFIKALGIPDPVPEFKFHPKRRWRIDYCWPEYSLAVEIEGGIWTYGRHNRAASMLKDMEKYNTLAVSGFYLLRFTPKDWNNGTAASLIVEFFKARKP